MSFDDDQDYLFNDGQEMTATETEQEQEVVQDEEVAEQSVSGENATPPVEVDQDDDQNEKMISEKRFKAALKSQQGQIEKLEAELSQYRAQPVPDRDTDPDGYELYVRLKTSDAIMTSQVPDYGNVIAHFKEMAKTNPMLEKMLVESETPALFAYQIAKDDMEISKARETLKSSEYLEFQEWKKSRSAAPAAKTSKQPSSGLAAVNVPNLNKASSSTVPTKITMEDDDFWKGSL